MDIYKHYRAALAHLQAVAPTAPSPAVNEACERMALEIIIAQALDRPRGLRAIGCAPLTLPT